MILLNEPWSHHERRIYAARRHESAKRALIFIICMALLATVLLLAIGNLLLRLGLTTINV